MEKAGVDMQIVSLPQLSTEQLDSPKAIALGSETNDFVMDAMKSEPHMATRRKLFKL